MGVHRDNLCDRELVIEVCQLKVSGNPVWGQGTGDRERGMGSDYRLSQNFAQAREEL